MLDDLKQKSYSAIEHVAYSVFLNHSPCSRWLAMFTAYFDDSGSPDDGSALVVAGYVSSIDQWLRFEREWNEILADVSVKRFHMKDFAHSRGEFEHLKGKESKRRRLIEQLVGTIRVRVRKSFSCVVILKDFRDVDGKYQLREYLGNPYSFCGRHCAARVRLWAQHYDYPESQIRYVFEQGAKGKGELITVMQRDGFPPPIFESKGLAPLQAADFVAWEHLKATKQAQVGDVRGFRRSLIELSRIPHDWGIYEKKQLVKLCKKFPRSGKNGGS